MIQELLEKYKDQQPKQYSNNVKEKSYPVSAVISMLEELTEQLRQYNVVRQSKQLNAFVEFYNNRKLYHERISYDEIEIYLESI